MEEGGGKMRRQLFAVLAAATLVVGFATTGNAASPASGSVGPSSSSVSWTGQSYTLAATQDPSACPPASDSSNSLCDHYSLKVAADSSYWNTHTGHVSISISWADGSNDFNLYVYSGSTQVAASAQSSGTSESVTINKPAGTYEVRVVPKKVLNSGYAGSAAFSSAATGTGGGGGGGGGHHGGGGGSHHGGKGGKGGNGGGKGGKGGGKGGHGGGKGGHGGGKGGHQHPTCPGCPSSFSGGGAPMAKEKVYFIYGIDRKSWYWESQINQTIDTPAGPENLTLPPPQNASTLPVQAQQGQPQKVPMVFFDLAQRGLQVGSRIVQFDLKIAEGDQAQDQPEYNTTGNKVEACLVTDFWANSDAGAEVWTGLPQVSSKCVVGKQGGTAPNLYWTFKLAPIVSGWDDPAKNQGIAFEPVIPKGAGPQNQNFQVNLLLPVCPCNETPPASTYKGTRSRAVVTIAFTSPASTNNPGNNGNNGNGTGNNGGTQPQTTGNFTGGQTLGQVTSGGPGFTSVSKRTTITPGNQGGGQPVPATQPLAHVPPIKVPGIVWWLIPLGLLGIWATRQAVMEPVGGMRAGGVISAIRDRNAAAKGIPVAEPEDTLTQARAVTRRARSALRRSLRRR